MRRRPYTRARLYGGGPYYYGGYGGLWQQPQLPPGRLQQSWRLVHRASHSFEQTSHRPLGRWLFLVVWVGVKTRWRRALLSFDKMSDSIERLYQAVIAAGS